MSLGLCCCTEGACARACACACVRVCVCVMDEGSCRGRGWAEENITSGEMRGCHSGG